jgi:ATP-dependent DNA helicase DinG
MHLGGLEEEVDGGILFKNDFVVFDEAHTVEKVASRHIGLSVSSAQLRYGLQRLWNPQTGKGLLAVLRRGGEKLVSDVLKESEKFFEDVEAACDVLAAERTGRDKATRRWSELRIRRSDLVPDNLTLSLQRVRETRIQRRN